MAKTTGIVFNMDNSDNEEREFDISCNVSKDSNGEYSVSNVNANKDGRQVANAHFRKGNAGNANVSVNIYGLPVEEHIALMTEIYAFAEQAIEKAGNNGYCADESIG